MTQPPDLPAYGTPADPTQPVPPATPPPPPEYVPPPQIPESVQYAASIGQKAGRTTDVVLSWLLYVAQILGSLVAGFIALFAIFFSDSCGSTASSTVPSLCDGDRLVNVIFGFWIALIALAVAVPVALIVAGVRGKPSWPWAVGGFGLTILSTIVFFLVVSA